MAGYRELLAVEWDKAAVETFELNFPGVPTYSGDIHELSAEECMRLAGGIAPRELDVLDGSPPCQGFSTAGKRKLDDAEIHCSRNTSGCLAACNRKCSYWRTSPDWSRVT